MAQDRGILVLFDLVSTLTDAGPRYVRAFQDVMVAHGFDRPDDDAVMPMLGNKNLSEITDNFTGLQDPEQKKQFMADCNTRCDALLTDKNWKEFLFPNVREAIEVMNLRGLTLGIYTGTREDAMNTQLDYHGIRPLVDARYIRGKDNDRDGMVKSSILKRAQIEGLVKNFRANQNNIKAPIIVVGDTKSDAEAARDLGLIFVGFAANDKKMAELQSAGVTHIVTNYGDLPDMVHRLIQPAANDLAPRPSPRQSYRP